jgi:glycosyltransferase involved in cell wall biosynthesis
MAPVPPRAAYCLDLSRLLRRLGHGPLTGIDRVEMAWLRYLVALEAPVFGLMRTSLGFVLLDRDGMAEFAAWVEGAPPIPGRDPLKPFRWLRNPASRLAESALSALALDRAHRLALPRMLSRQLPPGTHYLNVGHSNLRPRALEAWHSLTGARIAVMIHDTIPLDFPGSQRPGSVEGFRARLRAVAHEADLAVYVSAAARAAAEPHLIRAGRVPPGLVAPLGIDPPLPDPAALPPGLPPAGRYFVTLGTIEPRKDHALLLDIWENLGPGAPPLLVLGRRGWANAEVFRRLDALAATPGSPVREIAGLGDGGVAVLVAGAAALLMPSRAEGFGLPVAEAMALGTPVLATDLPVYREFAGDYPVYLPPGALYSWREAIRGMPAPSQRQGRSAGLGQGRRPDWADHFNLVLSAAW